MALQTLRHLQLKGLFFNHSNFYFTILFISVFNYETCPVIRNYLSYFLFILYIYIYIYILYFFYLASYVVYGVPLVLFYYYFIFFNYVFLYYYYFKILLFFLFPYLFLFLSTYICHLFVIQVNLSLCIYGSVPVKIKTYYCNHILSTTTQPIFHFK